MAQKLKLTASAQKTYEKLVKAGELTVNTGKANYVIVEPLLTAPIPKELVSIESKSRSGRDYKYGSLVRVDTDHPIIGSRDFPFAHGEDKKFEDADELMIGIYRLQEDILNDDKSVKVKAGTHTLRIACL